MTGVLPIITADQRMCLTCGHADGADVLGPLGQAAVDMHRAALLGKAGHVDDPGAASVEMRRHADDGNVVFVCFKRCRRTGHST